MNSPSAPSSELRQRIVQAARRVVVKVGTRVLSHEDGRLDTARVGQLADQLQWLFQSGREVVLVSSGAVGAGMSQLGWRQRPADLARLQAVAAVGQTKLIEEYDRHFRRHQRHAAQVLLTVDDLDHRARYLNVRNTLLQLLLLGAIPIINENDTVAVDELMTTFGDNDRLAAMVTNLLQAQLLVILSDVEGLYDRDPGQPEAQVIEAVARIDDATRGLVRDRLTGRSRGGMASKLEAARMVTLAGAQVIIASGRREGILHHIFAGQALGTLFLAAPKPISPFKRWIGFSARPRGKVQIDAGAVRAVVQQGRSLLPIGIRAVEGAFQKGDVISICDEGGREVARGLTNYHARELAVIAGAHSAAIADLLGHRPYDEAVHRDNLVLK